MRIVSTPKHVCELRELSKNPKTDNGVKKSAAEAFESGHTAIKEEDTKPAATVTLRFEGNSDDTFGEYAHFNDDYDNCASGKPIEYLVLGPVVYGQEQLGIVVTGQFGPGNSGSWMIGVANYDPDHSDSDFPRWPMRIEAQDYRNGFNPSLVIEAPEGVTIRCLQRDADDDAT